MFSLVIEVLTKNGIRSLFKINDLSEDHSMTENDVFVSLSGAMPKRVDIIPPEDDKIKSVSYLISIGLKNYNQVIIPDTGRTYSSSMELINFWGNKFSSRINNIRMPIFILTGMDMRSDYIFGIIGKNFETDFIVEEPATERALIAWMKRFTLKIQRGTEDYPVPEFAFSQDNSLTEYIYFKHDKDFTRPQTWFESLKEFADVMSDIIGTKPVTTADSWLPYWCSWTDWFSDDVTEQVIIDNVIEGVRLGIKNYIIDDGWFGPGLDSTFDVDLNIGDWEEDPSKIKNLKNLVGRIHEENANAIIWCAPHAVAPRAKCFGERKKYLIQNKKDVLLMTHNKFHSLCFMCPEAREIMANICVDLIKKYDVDGAKYDLFNCIPDDPCVNPEHEHNTTSMIEGLTKTLELIKKKTELFKKDYIVELKQNYATPYLYELGTVVRAGDTPYDPEGNFYRTAYINAYTPNSLNDYQTITNNDDVADAASIIIKMIAVGIPAYSIDLKALDDGHKQLIAYYNNWYNANLCNFKNSRIPLTPYLDSWLAKGNKKNIYFLLNQENSLNLIEIKSSEIVNGTFCKKINIGFPEKVSFVVEIDSVHRKNYFRKEYRNKNFINLISRPGDIIKIHPNRYLSRS